MISLLLVAATFAGLRDGNVRIVDFCQVAANPAAYYGREIIIRAEFMTDGIERSLLLDKNCKGKKGIGLGPELADRALDPVMPKIGPSVFVKTRRMIASFQGRVVREKPDGYMFYKDDGFRFAVRRVINVSARRTGN